MKIYGLTGGTGSGKSEVAAILREQGCEVIDADAISRQLTAKDKPLLRVLAAHYGMEIINEDGTLNRHLLADMAFASPKETHYLNDVVQTAVKIKFRERVYQLKNEGFKDAVFFDVPLLFECNLENTVDEIWTVTAPREIRLKRIMQRDGITEKQAEVRMALQMSEEEKAARSDVVINNNSGLETLKKQVLDIMRERLTNGR